jgi:hypothetical protein
MLTATQHIPQAATAIAHKTQTGNLFILFPHRFKLVVKLINKLNSV